MKTQKSGHIIHASTEGSLGTLGGTASASRISAARCPALPWHNLSFVLVEIERGSEFRLSQQQLLHACLMLERFVRLCGTRSRPLHAGFAPLKDLRLTPSSIHDFDRGALAL